MISKHVITEKCLFNKTSVPTFKKVSFKTDFFKKKYMTIKGEAGHMTDGGGTGFGPLAMAACVCQLVFWP